MQFGCAIVVALAMAACRFDTSTTAAGADSAVTPTGDGSTDAEVPDAVVPCDLPFVIDDRFENMSLPTGGPMSVSEGFTSVKNAANGNGSSAEVAGALLEIRTSNNMTGPAPVHGAASNTSFAFDSVNGMTIRLEVAAAETAIWNGIVLALQSNQGHADSAGGSLMLRVRGSQPRAFTIGMGTQNPNAAPVAEQPYDEAALSDGFVITWVLQADSWSYLAEGLLSNGGAITDSGSYNVDETPADLLDSTSHVAVHMQGNPSDTNQRVMQVGRLSVMTGVCP